MRWIPLQMVLLCLLALAFWAGGPLLLPAAARPAGMLFLTLALALLIAALAVIGPALAIGPEPSLGAPLVTRGIYRRFRHPMYTAAVCAALGLFLRRSSLEVGLAAAAVILFYLAKARYEESRLEARYAEYGAYRRRTWGVIPGWPSRSG